MISCPNKVYTFNSINKFPEIKVLYKIVNINNNRTYIDKTKNFKNRFYRHFTDLKYDSHHSIFLQRDYNKNNENIFIIKILQTSNSITELEKAERKLIKDKNINCEYNSLLISGEDFLNLPKYVQNKLNKDKSNKLKKAKKYREKVKIKKYNKVFKEAISFINEGKSVPEICNILNISPPYLLKIRKNNLQLIKDEYKNSRSIFYNTEKLNSDIKELLQANLSTRQIAKKLNVSKSTVFYRMKKYNLKK